MKYVLMIMLMASFAASPVRAEPVPDYVLDKDFQNCMGGADAKADGERAAYCNCIRDKMRSWDLDTYGNVATEQSQAGSHPVQSISDMAKECISQVLK